MSPVDAVDGSSTGTRVPWMWVLLKPPRFEEPKMQANTTIGLDIAKSVFQVHGVDAEGNVILRRRLKRRYVLAFFQKLFPCPVGIEACGSAHHWSRSALMAFLGRPAQCILLRCTGPFLAQSVSAISPRLRLVSNEQRTQLGRNI
jgi:hypothetical protein